MANKKATPVRTTTQSSKQLPKTGEESTSLTVTVIGSFMVLAAFALKRLKSKLKKNASFNPFEGSIFILF